MLKFSKFLQKYTILSFPLTSTTTVLYLILSHVRFIENRRTKHVVSLFFTHMMYMGWYTVGIRNYTRQIHETKGQKKIGKLSVCNRGTMKRKRIFLLLSHSTCFDNVWKKIEEKKFPQLMHPKIEDLKTLFFFTCSHRDQYKDAHIQNMLKGIKKGSENFKHVFNSIFSSFFVSNLLPFLSIFYSIRM